MFKKLFKSKANKEKEKLNHQSLNNQGFKLGKSQPNSDPEIVKVILAGPSNSGKTCFCLNHFQEPFISTIGIDFRILSMKVKHGAEGKKTEICYQGNQAIENQIQGEDLGFNFNKQVKLQLWDTAGLNKFQTITNSYFGGGNVIIFFFALNSRESFEQSMKTYERVINQNLANNLCKGIVIGTKADLERQVSTEEGKEFARRVNGLINEQVGYYEISLKEQPKTLSDWACIEIYRFLKNQDVQTLKGGVHAAPQSQPVALPKKEESKNYPIMKTVVFGPSFSGKSKLVHRYCDDEFIDGYMPTIGVDFCIKTIESNGIPVKVQVWDITSKFWQQSIIKSYSKGMKIGIFLYDCTKEESLKETFESIIPRVEEVIKKQQFPYICLVANKCFEEESIPEEVEKGRALAAEKKWDFAEISCKNNIGVDELFNYSVDWVLKNNKEMQEKIKQFL